VSKLTKLLFSPRAFFRDWKTNREFDRLAASGAAPEEMIAALRDDGLVRQTGLDPRKVFETFVVPHFKMIRLPDSRQGFVNVGVLAEERVRLLKALFVLVAKLPIELVIEKQGSQFSLLELSFREGFNLLFDDRQWIIDFKQDRNLFNRFERGKGGAGDLPDRYQKKIDEFLREVLSSSGNQREDQEGIREFLLEDAPEVQRIRITIWREKEGFYQSGVENIVASKLPVSIAEQSGIFDEGKGTRLEVIHPCPIDAFCSFPIDFVYTWVNNRDPDWQQLYREHARRAGRVSDDTMSMDRFFNRDELKYSLRSVDQFAPWVRKVFVVTNCAPPEWADLSNEKLCFVDHEEIFDKDDLPTFNSHAIEARLHHIPDLSTHFVYFNDDMFLGRGASKEDFFLSNGVSASILETYGMVNGELNKDDPDYLNAARNGKRLIEQRFGLSPTQLHTHSPYCLNKDVLFEMESEFKSLFDETASSRFRAITNISVPSFFYHHYAYHTGKAFRKWDKTILLKVNSANFDEKVRDIRRLGCFSFCLNDGSSSTDDRSWNRTVVEIITSVFPRKSSFEKL
jgi:hypothetical protein